MSEENNNNKEVHKLGDDLIAVVRELVQLTFLTGTNIVDHMRAVQVEIDEETGKIVPTVEYIEAYERMITELNEQAQEVQKEHEKSQQLELNNAGSADDDSNNQTN